ncbi:unnamed protein product [Ranitomeya imitator]|uniref:Uncharacterized protein n=1 Tax=Ranitomeya imitator TaxID=111125 RepID=A0ABN9KXX2_9NEOB|nr:unnamed protein product [Ranitomeya imitator]
MAAVAVGAARLRSVRAIGPTTRIQSVLQKEEASNNKSTDSASAPSSEGHKEVLQILGHIQKSLSSSLISFSLTYRYTKRLTNDHDQLYDLAVIVGKSLCGCWRAAATNDQGNDFGIVETVFNDAEVPG